jgi:hypothetical protein
MQDSVSNPATIHFAPATPQIAGLKQKKTNKRQLKKKQTAVLSALAQ